jgi:hypothetical protein
MTYKIHLKTTEIFLFLAKSVTKFMFIGYSFKSSLK